jgi:hypothetical protein
MTEERQKTIVEYERKDPNDSRVKYIAIASLVQEPYVWETFDKERREDIRKLPEYLLVLPIAQARNLFEFRKTRLENIS